MRKGEKNNGIHKKEKGKKERTKMERGEKINFL
jgi:hypothetical protein